MDAITAVCWDFPVYPSRGQGILGRVLTFAGYIHHNKIFPGNISGFLLKNKMFAMGIS